MNPGGNVRRRRFYWLLGGVTTLALLLRLGAGLQLARVYPAVARPSSQTDMYTYAQLARQVLDGSYDYGQGFYYQPFYYTAFLPGCFRLFGTGATGVIVVQSLLGAACVWLTGLAFAALAGRRCGLLSALLLALAHFHIFYTPFMLVAVLQSFWMCLLVWTSLLAAKRGQVWRWLVVGLIAGLATCTRGNVILFLPLILALIAWTMRRRPRPMILALVLLLAGAYLPQLPYGLVNYRAHGRWVGASTAADNVLALGNTPEAPPGGREPGTGAGPMAYPASCGEWMRQAALAEPDRVAVVENMWHWFKREPLAYIELKFRMLLLFWHRGEIPNNVAWSAFGQRLPASILHLPFLLSFAVIGSLALAGMALALRRRRALVWYLVGITIVYCASVVLFYVLARFRVPLLPLLCGFGGIALETCWRQLRQYRARRPAPGWRLTLAALALATIAVNFGYDAYRYGWERRVMRIVRPNGVRVQLQHEWLVTDAGPLQFGGWTPLAAAAVTKTWLLPFTEQPRGPLLVRFAVTSEVPGHYDFSVGSRTTMTSCSAELGQGLTWVGCTLPDDCWQSPGLVVATIAPAAGPSRAALWFDAQRDYGRTVAADATQVLPGELIAELHLPRD